MSDANRLRAKRRANQEKVFAWSHPKGSDILTSAVRMNASAELAAQTIGGRPPGEGPRGTPPIASEIVSLASAFAATPSKSSQTSRQIAM